MRDQAKRVPAERIGSVLGGFRLLERIGVGGMGEVYRAVNVRVDKMVRAVKVIRADLAADEAFRARFLREAEYLELLRHPSILRIDNIGEDGGVLFMVMELLSGSSVEAVLRVSPRGLPIDEVLGVLLPALDGLAQAHRHGVCHRDLKPSNLFVTDDDQVKVLDFGVARGEEATRLTRTGQWTPCTPTHYAPEFAEGTPASPSSDVYALGIVLYELLTGSLPFRAGGGSDSDALLSLIVQHVSSPLPDVRRARPDVPEALLAVLARATAKRPEDRYRDAGAFRVQLEAVARALPGSAPRPPRAALAGSATEGATGDDRVVVGGTTDDAYRGTEPAEPPLEAGSSGREDDDEYRGTRPIDDSSPAEKAEPARPGLVEPPRGEAPVADRSRTAERPATPIPARRRPLARLLLLAFGVLAVAGAAAVLRERGAPTRPRSEDRRAASAAAVRRIPSGCFTMGSSSGDADEMPAHEVCLDAYEMDTVEVTNEQYGGCGAAGACRAVVAEAGFDEPGQPVVGVSWRDAEAFCRWAGKTLPSEAQWERAARGSDDRRYPWGTRIDCGASNYGAWMECKDVNPGRPRVVGTTPRDLSPFGVRDLGGNVREWVRDWYDGGYYTRSPKRNPEGPDSGSVKVVRGGSWFGYADNLRSAIRDALLPSDRSGLIGFRCARSAR